MPNLGLKAKGHWETFIRIQGWHIASNVASVKQSVQRTSGLCIIHSRVHRIQFSMAPSVYKPCWILVRSQNNWVVSIHKSRRKPRLAGRAVLKLVLNPIWSLPSLIDLAMIRQAHMRLLVFAVFLLETSLFFLNSLIYTFSCFAFCTVHSFSVYCLDISSFSSVQTRFYMEITEPHAGRTVRDLRFTPSLTVGLPWAPLNPWRCFSKLPWKLIIHGVSLGQLNDLIDAKIGKLYILVIFIIKPER